MRLGNSYVRCIQLARKLVEQVHRMDTLGERQVGLLGWTRHFRQGHLIYWLFAAFSCFNQTAWTERPADSNWLPGYPATMHLRYVKLKLLIMAVCVAFPLWAQQAVTRQVTIAVSDASGGAIPRARIRLVPSPDPAPAKSETDEKGQLTLNLKSGEYAIFVSAQGFKSARLHMDVLPGVGNSGASQLFPVKLDVGAVGGPVEVSDHPKDSLVITAEPYHTPVAFTPADIRALPHLTAKVHNGHMDKDETYSGVPLVTLLAKVNAPVGKELRKEAYTIYIVATGSDGYAVLLSLAEVDPDFHAGQVLVADMRDGEPLGKNGPFQLIVSDDKRPARWVRNLQSLTLQNAR